jgi:hypothetical protein
VFVLSLLGIGLRNVLFDRLYAFWFLIVNITWILLARFTG